MNTCALNKTNIRLQSKSPMQVENIPLQEIAHLEEQALETATRVFNCAIQTQSKVCTIHGPFSEHENKEKFSHVYSNNSGNDFYLPKNEVLHINPGDRSISLIFSGLRNNTIIINGKVNHVLIRKSENVRLDIKDGTLSGVDIIYCKKMKIKMPYHNFTNLEFGENIQFEAELRDISQLHFTGSLDVKINDVSIPINPFINAMFGKDGWCYKKQSGIPKLMICRY